MKDATGAAPPRGLVRRYWKHLVAGHLAVGAIVVVLVFIVGVFSAPYLNAKGRAIYKRVATSGLEFGQKKLEREQLPPALAKKIAAVNDQVAAGVAPVRPLASPEPLLDTSIVRNQSSRNGARPVLLVVHDTESPNTPGSPQGRRAIVSWFNNPVSQGSSNYTTDSDGNTTLMVRETDKAWTQAFFNPWAISDELIGHMTQPVWPDTQMRAVARLFAAAATRWHIPIQHGLVSGCTIVRPGILQHRDLGQCGGGHVDAGPHFPIGLFIGLVKAYAAGGYHPVPHLKPKPVKPPIVPATLRARTGYWSWLAWRLGAGAWKPYGKTNPTVRPHVARTVPHSWWRLAAAHVKGAH